MHCHKNSGLNEKLRVALTWVAVLYLLAWLFDWLIRRKAGLFLVLTCIATMGWGLLISPILYYAGDTDGGLAVAISLPLGILSALLMMVREGIIRVNSRKRRQLGNIDFMMRQLAR